MRQIPTPLQAALSSGVTTLARCWRVARRDGTTLGFTDHDQHLAFGGLTYRAESGMTASAAESSLGLNVDGLEVVGALDDAGLSDADLARGAYDGAAVELILVDWSDVSSRLTLFSGALGEVTREGGAFMAELRSLAHALNQPRGRIYQKSCDAALGDARCGVNIAIASRRVAGSVTAPLGARSFRSNALEDRGSAFERGRLIWTSGANDGAAAEARRQADDFVELAEAPPMPIAAGDGFVLTAGCDKSFETCRTRFNNERNFRGFPQMPGNDWLTRSARQNDDLDGGRLV